MKKSFSHFIILLLVASTALNLSATPQRRSHGKSRARTHRVADKTAAESPKATSQTETPVSIPTAAADNRQAADVASAARQQGPCQQCAAMPGRCAVCHGSGKKIKVTVEQGTQYVACEACHGTGICPHCKGNPTVPAHGSENVVRAPSKQTSAQPRIKPKSYNEPVLNIGYQELENGKDKNAGGLYVNSVAAGGNAEVAGMKVGDVIMQLNDDKIADRRDLQSAINKMRDNDVAYVKVWRNQTSIYLAVPCGKKAYAQQSATSQSPRTASQQNGAKRTVQFPFKVRITTVDNVVIEAIAYGIDATTVYYRKQSDPNGDMYSIQKNQVVGFDF